MLLSFLVKFLYLKIRVVLYQFYEWKQKFISFFWVIGKSLKQFTLSKYTQEN